jgi:hypothetical protein
LDESQTVAGGEGVLTRKEVEKPIYNKGVSESSETPRKKEDFLALGTAEPLVLRLSTETSIANCTASARVSRERLG